MGQARSTGEAAAEHAAWRTRGGGAGLERGRHPWPRARPAVTRCMECSTHAGVKSRQGTRAPGFKAWRPSRCAGGTSCTHMSISFGKPPPIQARGSEPPSARFVTASSCKRGKAPRPAPTRRAGPAARREGAAAEC